MLEKLFKGSSDLPAGHRLGKLLVAAVAGFVASEMAEKGYDLALKTYKRKFKK